MRTITIAAPIRNREFIIEEYLKHIFQIDYPKDKISLHFVINDSVDDTARHLAEFKKKHGSKYKRIKIDIYNRNIPLDCRVLDVRVNYVYRHLSILKNFIMKNTKTDYLLFVDTDILVKPDIITNLLNHNKDIVSSLIWNGYIVSPDSPHLYPNIMRLKSSGVYEHISNSYVKKAENNDSPRLIEVDLTGAVILLSKKVYASIKYGHHPQGEDAYFCKMAQDRGFQIFCDLGSFSQHIMDENMLERHLNKCNRELKLNEEKGNVISSNT